MEILKATSEDVPSIVEIHQAAFKTFFLTSLGTRFLRLYYSTFILSNKGVVLCAKNGDNIVGFSATSYLSKGFNISLIKGNFIKYGVEAFFLLISKPKALIRLAKNMNKECKNDSFVDDGSYAELYSIAVDPSYQGGGVGRALLSMTEKDVMSHNDTISLTTDYYDNDKAICFYHSLGYNEYYDFITYPNRRMWRLIKRLN